MERGARTFVSPEERLSWSGSFVVQGSWSKLGVSEIRMVPPRCVCKSSSNCRIFSFISGACVVACELPRDRNGREAFTSKEFLDRNMPLSLMEAIELRRSRKSLDWRSL